MARALAVTSRV
ncbi:hypothetical protein YPPY101_1098, partial [Yersinia pestis PY-101]